MFANKYLNLSYIFIFALIIGIATNTSVVSTAKAGDHEHHKHKKLDLKIKGMDCEHCAKAVNAIISKCTGVTGCAVEYKEGKAIVEVEADEVQAEAEEIIHELEGAGYGVPEWDIEDVY